LHVSENEGSNNKKNKYQPNPKQDLFRKEQETKPLVRLKAAKTKRKQKKKIQWLNKKKELEATEYDQLEEVVSGGPARLV
jgi:hypothetical protein